MLEAELELPVSVGLRALARVQQGSPRDVLRVQGRARNGCVEHELVELGLMIHRVLDGLFDVLRSVLLESDDRRAEHRDAVGAECAHQRERVDPAELSVAAVLALQTHPHPRDPHAH